MLVIDSIFNIFNGLFNHSQRVDLSKLPSQGKFYPNDFELKIKKADLEHIIDYEHNFDKENLFVIVESLKKIVRNNIIISKGYTFEDIKSVDLVFLFLEIVKFTTKRNIFVPYYNQKKGQNDSILFSSDNFNYFDFSKYEIDSDTKEILIDGYKFSLPSIGIENCLTIFLANKINSGEDLNKYFYDFLFFVGNKNYLSQEELENLFLIFNYDIDDSERNILKGVVNKFMKIIGYSLKVDDDIVEIKTKIDLQTIWKDK
jgi:hypothetical protein